MPAEYACTQGNLTYPALLQWGGTVLAILHMTPASLPADKAAVHKQLASCVMLSFA
jgi:hypothetical protein